MIDPKLILRETPFWTWSLFPNQCYLGRVQMTLRRECHGSLADVTPEEWLDLRESIKAYEELAAKLFQPDRFNYVQLGNVWPQVHVHAIPRYATSRNWNGTEFSDRLWGELPLPEPASPVGEPEVLELIKMIRSEI